MGNRKIVVGTSGGVTSAWALGWALRNYPRSEVIPLFHDTKEEDSDTYRFLREISATLGVEIVERSDGRSVTEVALDHNAVPNDRMAFCSQELKQIPGNNFIRELQENGATEIIRVFGFSANEMARVQRQAAVCWSLQTLWCTVEARYPIIETGTTKQECWDWCQCTMGITPPAMYAWSDHANCPGCFRGGIGYWRAVAENAPEVFKKRAEFERYIGHSCLPDVFLDELLKRPVKRVSPRKEAIDIGPCECGG